MHITMQVYNQCCSFTMFKVSSESRVSSFTFVISCGSAPDPDHYPARSSPPISPARLVILSPSLSLGESISLFLLFFPNKSTYNGSNTFPKQTHTSSSHLFLHIQPKTCYFFLCSVPTPPAAGHYRFFRSCRRRVLRILWWRGFRWSGV